MLLAHTLYSVQLDVNLLAGSQLGDEDVVEEGPDRVHGKDVGLGALRDPLDLGGVEPRVLVLVLGVSILGRSGLLCALFPQLKDNCVHVRGLLPGGIVKLARVSVDGEQAEAVGEDLVGDDGCVVDDEYMLDGHGGDVVDHDAAQRVGDRAIQPDHVELGKVFAQLLHLDGDRLSGGEGRSQKAAYAAKVIQVKGLQGRVDKVRGPDKRHLHDVGSRRACGDTCSRPTRIAPGWLSSVEACCLVFLAIFGKFLTPCRPISRARHPNRCWATGTARALASDTTRPACSEQDKASKARLKKKRGSTGLLRIQSNSRAKGRRRSSFGH